MAPVGKTFTHATAAARSLIHAIVLGLSATGEVFGMQTIVVNPPAAAARAPDSIVSLCVKPGSRRCTCRSIKPGATIRLLASISSISDLGFRCNDLSVFDIKIRDFGPLVRGIDNPAITDYHRAHSIGERTACPERLLH